MGEVVGASGVGEGGGSSEFGGDLWGGPGPQRGVRRLDGQLPNLGPRWVRRPPLLNKSRRSEHAQPPTFHSPLPNRPSAKRALTQRGPTHRRFFRERWGSAVTYGSEVPAGILKGIVFLD